MKKTALNVQFEPHSSKGFFHKIVKNRTVVGKFNTISLSYADNLIENYQKLANLPGFILLESSDKTKGRYDILSAFPYEQVKRYSNSSEPGEIFAQLQQLIPQTSSTLDLPFQGGALGYFSYDLAAQLAGISTVQQLSLEDMPLVDLGLYDWAIISDHHLKKVTLFQANSQPQTVELVKEVLACWEGKSEGSDSFIFRDSFRSLISKAAYQDAFYAIHQDLRRGRAYQVNYTQPFNAPYQGDTWAIYKKIRAKNPVPFSAFFRSNEADILSFSPERFLMMDRGNLLTSPIKGTAKRSSEQLLDDLLRQELLTSTKNRAENIMIVDLLRNDLGKIAQAGSVKVSALCEVESYESVHHLVSHVEAQCLKDKSLLQAFRACFPGGSITGAPKLEAMKIIAEQEHYGRGVYCGSIGYFSSHGRFDTNIAIRTLIARNEILHLAAGGGLVIDSNWEEEYFECFTKIAAIVNGLN